MRYLTFASALLVSTALFAHSEEGSVQKLLEQYQFIGSEKVLDIGCREGALTAAIAKQVPRGFVVGVDLSHAMVDLAKDLFGARQKNVAFQVKDLSELQYKEQFDLVTSFTSMPLIVNQLNALKSFEQFLKPGGLVWIQMPTRLPASLESALRLVTEKDRWKPYFMKFSPRWHFYQPDEYRPLLQRAKLKPTTLQVIRKTEAFASRAEFQSALRQWLPFLAPLPTNLKESFLTEVVDAYLEISPNEASGSIIYESDVLNVQAEKSRI